MRSNWAAASVRNIRTQRLLELELLDIERSWHLELKYLNRKRLGVIFDLKGYTNHKRTAEYVTDGLCGQPLRQYTRMCQDRMYEQRATRRRARKFEFNVDPVQRMHIRLPPIDVDTTAEKHGVTENVTSSDLNRKRANLQKGATELSQFLMRTVGRKNRRKSDLEDEYDEEEFVEAVDEGEKIEAGPVTRKGSVLSRPLPPINDVKQ